VRDEERYEPILQETRPLGNVTINNNVVVNNVVNITYVEQKTNEKVVVHQVEKTKDASKAGKMEGTAVEVFQPAPDQVPKIAAPPKPKKIEQVAVESKTKEQGVGKPSTDELLVPPEIRSQPVKLLRRPPYLLRRQGDERVNRRKPRASLNPEVLRACSQAWRHHYRRQEKQKLRRVQVNRRRPRRASTGGATDYAAGDDDSAPSTSS
jgi:hypothetical protein